MPDSREVLKDFLAPLALLFALTALIAWTGADLFLESLFYRPGSGWIHADQNPWKFLYDFGLLPTNAIAACSVAVAAAGFFSARARLYRKRAVFMLLLVLLGPVLLGSSLIKERWGRPRPHQVQLFGGDKAFHQVWERGERGDGRSFPSGHASTACYLIAPFFLLRRSSPKWARIALAAGLSYGVLMGIARMVQGGHFASDVLWSGGLVYLFGLSLYYLMGLDKAPCYKVPPFANQHPPL